MATGQKRPLKPLAAVINGQSSLARGLVFDSLLYERGGTQPSDLVGKLKATFTGAPAWNTDLYGTNLTFAAATDLVSYATPTGSSTLSLINMAYECMFNMTGTGGGALGYVVCKSSSGPPYFLLNVKTATTMQVLSGFATTQGNWTFPITQNAWNHVVINYAMTTAATPTVWVNGVQQTLTLVASAAGTAPTDTANIYIGNNSSGTRNWAGQISHVRMWNRNLTAAEAMKLNLNPWALYTQPNRTKRRSLI